MEPKQMTFHSCSGALAVTIVRKKIRRRLLVLSCDSGQSMIEFAVIAPFLILLVLGIGDMGRSFSDRFTLQQAVNRTIEMAHLGTGDSDYGYLVPEAAAAAKVPQSNVTLEKWIECNGVPSTYASTCRENEETARFITLRVVSSYRPLFRAAPFWKTESDGTIRLNAEAALRVQ